MDRRWLLWMTAAAATVVAGCASGDGAPEARVLNGLRDGCIVEASFLGYNFTTPIAPTGSMASREVYEGTDKAYAVVMPVPAADNNGDGRVDCYDTATLEGGTLWVTNKSYTAKAGQKIDISFSPDGATAIATDCNDVTFREGEKRFSRLTALCTGTP